MVSEQSTVAHSPAPAAPDSGTVPARSVPLLGWSIAAAAAATGAAGGGQMFLMAKPIGGIIDVPGEVVGYIALTAALLGCLTALAAPRLLSLTSARAGAWSALGAGAALILAGVADEPIQFCVATSVAGALVGITYTTGRMHFGAAGAAARAARRVMTWLGLLAAAALSWAFYSDPMSGLLVAGVVAAGFGVLAVPLSTAPAPLTEPTPPGAGGTPDRRVLFAYGAAGFAVAAAVTPGLFLISHRWEVIGVDQMPLVGAAALAAVVAVVLPLRPQSVALLLVVAAGGLPLIAVAPGSATAAIGLAVTVAAVARALADLDRITARTTARSSARAVCVGGIGAVTGLATAELLREIVGGGTAVTLTAFPALVLTAAWTLLAAPPTGVPLPKGAHS